MERKASVPSAAKDVYLAANTSVWLDIDYCGGVTDGNSVAEDIKSALSNLGFSGAVSIFIYGSNIPESVQRAAGITFNHVTPENRNLKPLLDLSGWVGKSRPPANILLLFGANDLSMQFMELVDFLFKEGYNVRRFAKPMARWSGLELELEEECMAEEAHRRYKVAMERIYKSSITSVWWDMVTCKPPSGCCHLDRVANNICSALFNLDYCGPVSIFTYGGRDNNDPKPHRTNQVKLTNCMLVNHVSRKMMIRDMMHWVTRNPAPANVLIVSSDTDLADALESEYNVIFAVPSSPLVEDLRVSKAGKTVWISSDLLAGRPPIGTTITASRALAKYLAGNTSVWWDMEDCKVPEHCNVTLIAKSIRSALSNLGYQGPVCISAYGGDTTGIIRQSDQFARSGISLKPAPLAGDTQIIMDMFTWISWNRAPANLLLISGRSEVFSSALRLIGERFYNVLLCASLPVAAETVRHWHSGIENDILAGGSS